MFYSPIDWLSVCFEARDFGNGQRYFGNRITVHRERSLRDIRNIPTGLQEHLSANDSCCIRDSRKSLKRLTFYDSLKGIKGA